jgi:hypothetical protein
MKAFCPTCKGENKDCTECDGSGYTEVRMAEGMMFTTICINDECRFVNGGFIADSYPERSSEKCIECGHDTDYILTKDIPEDVNKYLEHMDVINHNTFGKSLHALRKVIEKLRTFSLDHLPDDYQLTAQEAALLSVCRICKKSSRENMPFTYVDKNDNHVFSHSRCLENENK